jgi:hypothetical protein
MLALLGLMTFGCGSGQEAGRQQDQAAVAGRIRRDVDRDGYQELAAEYDAKGRLRSVEIDQDRDGRPELSASYENGRLKELIREQARDEDDDGAPDRWERFGSAGLFEILSDHDGDGRPDQWEHFGPGGRLLVIEFDRDGDGRPDQRVELAD